MSTVPLKVKADNKVIFKGDPLPAFTSTYTGFKNDDQTKIISGFKYLAKFSYKNSNSVPVFVPRGPDNSMTSLGQMGGQQPELFNPGTGYFSIPFDGKKITWNLKTYEGYTKVTETATASSTSKRCSVVRTTSNPTTTQRSAAMEVTEQIVFGVYPNPVTDKVTISFKNVILQSKDVTVYDVAGKLQSVKQIRKVTDGSLSLDLSPLAPGVYMISVRVKNETKTTMILKK
ncbi:MAG: T9SS type A sorting domain-containing protein [Chitinophagaceae bacterium]|nr:T9SS type A sorting domain-containing protein [Chitinophagaceae bacterium]